MFGKSVYRSSQYSLFSSLVLKLVCAMYVCTNAWGCMCACIYAWVGMGVFILYLSIYGEYICSDMFLFWCMDPSFSYRQGGFPQREHFYFWILQELDTGCHFSSIQYVLFIDWWPLIVLEILCRPLMGKCHLLCR